jgi:hypothetical protein
MASRVVDGPDGGQFISAEDAARWLGLHPDDEDFEELAERHPWFRPVRIGESELFDWLDVFLLGQLLRRETPAPPKG